MIGNTAPDLATLREGLHVSYSQVRTFLICPAKLEHSHILGTEPSHRPVALVLGGSVHHALAAYYGHVHQTGVKMPLEDLRAAFRDRFDAELDKEIPIRFDDKADSGAVIDQGIALLSAFHEQADTPEVVAVEQPFSVDLVDPVTGECLDPKLVGAFDLITQEADRPVIVEHKTAARKYTRDQLAWDLQPSVYAYAAQEMGMGPVGLRYQVLVKTRTPAVEICDVERTDAHITEMLETVNAVLRAIEAGVFYRNRGWACGDCQFAYRCDGYETGFFVCIKRRDSNTLCRYRITRTRVCTNLGRQSSRHARTMACLSR